MAVIGKNFRIHRADTDGTFLALPTEDLNVIQYKYIELNIVLGAVRWPSQVLVVGTQPNTTMNITLTQAVRTIIDGITVNLVIGTIISAKPTRTLTSYTAFTGFIGTKITTDKPTLLFSGHACTKRL